MIRLTGVLLASLAWGATAVAGGDCVAARTLKDVPVYEPGEEIAFELSVRGFEGRDRAGWCFSWQRTGDDGKREEGKAPADKPFVYRTSLDRPGFVRLHGTLVAADGKPVRRIVREKSVPTIFDLGAGVAIGKIAPAAAEPADFDALWARHRANLAGVAWKDAVQLKAIPSPVAGMRLYEFSLPCYGGHPATGHLAVPEKAGLRRFTDFPIQAPILHGLRRRARIRRGRSSSGTTRAGRTGVRLRRRARSPRTAFRSG